MTTDDLRKQINDLNNERNDHLDQRSEHDKRNREIKKAIAALNQQIIKKYEAQPIDAEAVDALKAKVAELTKEQEDHAATRSTHDKRARELGKSIGILEKELINLYEKQPVQQPLPSMNGTTPEAPAAPPSHSRKARRVHSRRVNETK